MDNATRAIRMESANAEWDENDLADKRSAAWHRRRKEIIRESEAATEMRLSRLRSIPAND